MTTKAKEATLETETKPQSLADVLPPDEDELDDKELIAKLVGPDGKLKVDLSLPADYELEIMAEQMVDHLSAYSQNRQAWRSARNQGDNAKAKQLFQSMNYNQLTVAIIQAEFPKARKIADDIMKAKTKQIEANRKKFLEAE